MSLMLHAGANEASFNQVAAVATPEPEGRWFPIPHVALVERTQNALEAVQLEVTDQKFGVWKDGMRFFGVLELRSRRADYSTVVGLRNSHDQTFCASLACGSRVFVCDNLAFSGEIVVGRKHTTNILQDLERLVMQAIGKLVEANIVQEKRIDAYHDTEIDNQTADHLIMQAFRSKVINVQRIAHVNKNWREPEFEEFEPRNVYSLFNAFTSTMRTQPLLTLNATPRLHGMLDTYCGLAA